MKSDYHDIENEDFIEPNVSWPLRVTACFIPVALAYFVIPEKAATLAVPHAQASAHQPLPRPHL